jgi:hypothetical protein
LKNPVPIVLFFFSFFEEKLNSNQNCAQRPYFVEKRFACGGLVVQSKQKLLGSATAFSCDRIKIKKKTNKKQQQYSLSHAFETIFCYQKICPEQKKGFSYLKSESKSL